MAEGYDFRVASLGKFFGFETAVARAAEAVASAHSEAHSTVRPSGRPSATSTSRLCLGEIEDCCMADLAVAMGRADKDRLTLAWLQRSRLDARQDKREVLRLDPGGLPAHAVRGAHGGRQFDRLEKIGAIREA